MGGADRFTELLEQVTRQLQEERQREINDLVATIDELKARLDRNEPSSPHLQSSPHQERTPLPQGACGTQAAAIAQETPGHGGTQDGEQTLAVPDTRIPTPTRLRRSSTFSQDSPRNRLKFSAGHEEQYSSIAALAHIERFVRSSCFEVFVCVLIASNGIVMALEAQHRGLSVAADLGYDHGTMASKWHSGAEELFEVSGWCFGVVFTIELALRLMAMRTRFLCDPWNWLDSAIVTLWVIGRFGSNLLINPQLIRLARFGKLARLLRLFRSFEGFDSLYLLMSSLRHSFAVLGWSGCLLFVIMVFNSLTLNGLLTEFYFKNDAIPLSDRMEIFRYFGTFSSSLFSMFELTLANWPPISRALYENVSEWFILIAVVHKLTIGFAVIGVVNAVFIQETFKVAQQDDELMLRQARMAGRVHANKMRQLVATVDQTGEGMLGLDDFRRMFQDPGIKSWLASMQLDPHDVDSLFNMMDDGDGVLTLDELISGVGRLKGSARSIDLNMMLREQRQLRGMLERCLAAQAVPI